MSCPTCKIDNNQEVRSDFVYGGTRSHTFLECLNCSLIYLNPKLSKEEEKKFYAKEFEKFMEKRSGDDFDWSGPQKHIETNQVHVKRRMKVLEPYIKQNSDILEIGCSSGFMLKEYSKYSKNIIGIEPSDQFSSYLTNTGFKNYSSMDKMIEDIPDQTFDLITHYFVLEHISDTASFLQSQLDLLKPGGKIIAEVPNANDPLTSLYKIDAFEKFYWSIAHHYYFTPKSLDFILKNIACKHKYILDQRYDLSNHIVWLQDGRPGGQGRYDNIFSKATLDNYKKDIIASEKCDTFFLVLENTN